MNRPFFVGSHLQVTSGLLAIGKEEKNVSNDIINHYNYILPSSQYLNVQLNYYNQQYYN